MPSAMKAHSMTERREQRQGLSRGPQNERKEETGSQAVWGQGPGGPPLRLSSFFAGDRGKLCEGSCPNQPVLESHQYCEQPHLYNGNIACLTGLF